MPESQSLQDRERSPEPKVVTPPGGKQPVSVALPEAVRRIVQVLNPDRVVLFGSYAYGVPTVDSDVDLLIVMETNASGTERYLAVCRLLRPRPFPVDIVVKTPREIKQAIEQGDPFIGEIMSRGEVLYERHG